MDNSVLVRFAAEKVGGVVDEDLEGNLRVKMEVEIEGENGEKLTGSNFYNITSPGLFFKGLVIYHKEKPPFQMCPWGVRLGDQATTFDATEWVPEMFWECWYAMEKVKGGIK